MTNNTTSCVEKALFLKISKKKSDKKLGQPQGVWLLLQAPVKPEIIIN